MQRIVLRRAVLAASLCSSLSVAQTLRPRPSAGTPQTNGAVMSLTDRGKGGGYASDDADERGGGDTDQGGAGFGGADSQL